MTESYGEAHELAGEIWSATGKIQAEQYGERLAYIRNCRVEESYNVVIGIDSRGAVTTAYELEDGTRMMEGDGMCLYGNPESIPDYRIVAIRPYRYLTMECEKL